MKQTTSQIIKMEAPHCSENTLQHIQTLFADVPTDRKCKKIRTTYWCSTFPQITKNYSASTILNTPDSNKTQNQTVLKKILSASVCKKACAMSAEK